MDKPRRNLVTAELDVEHAAKLRDLRSLACAPEDRITVRKLLEEAIDAAHETLCPLRPPTMA